MEEAKTHLTLDFIVVVTDMICYQFNLNACIVNKIKLIIRDLQESSLRVTAHPENFKINDDQLNSIRMYFCSFTTSSFGLKKIYFAVI